MNDDYVKDLRAFCDEYLKQNQGCDLIDHGFGSEHGGELTTVKLAAVLSELEQTRAAMDAVLLLAGVLEGLPRHNGTENAARVADLMAKAIKAHAVLRRPEPDPAAGCGWCHPNPTAGGLKCVCTGRCPSLDCEYEQQPKHEGGDR